MKACIKTVINSRNVNDVEKGFGFKDVKEVESWGQGEIKTEESRTPCSLLEKVMIVVYSPRQGKGRIWGLAD